MSSNSLAARLVVPFEQLRMTDVEVVGGKNASLGEMISQLAASGVRVPGGFATTAHAFRTFVEPLETEFGMKSNHRIGRFSDVAKSQEYTDRIEAINFSLAHDDGQSAKNLAEADVILVGVSRSGKTPTSIYLAMQHGIKAANYPLIPEDFERGKLPSTLVPFKAKCFGLTIDPDRLARIRTERRPHSKYASLENCRYEVREGETMMKREGIAWLSSTHKSIEEIATTILRDLRPDRLTY